jgi:hypothetical protein
MLRRGLGRGSGAVGGAFPRHGHARGEECTLIGLIFVGYPQGDRLQTLKAGGGFEVGALLAAMQRRIAFRTEATEIGPRRQGGGTTETPRRRNVLNQTRQAGAGHIQRRARSLGLGAVFAAARPVGIAVRIHVPVLSVLAVAVHGEGCSVTSRKETFCKLLEPKPLSVHGGTAQAHFLRTQGWKGDQRGITEGVSGKNRLASQDRRPLLLQIHRYHGMGPLCTQDLELWGPCVAGTMVYCLR